MASAAAPSRVASAALCSWCRRKRLPRGGNPVKGSPNLRGFAGGCPPVWLLPGMEQPSPVRAPFSAPACADGLARGSGSVPPPEMPLPEAAGRHGASWTQGSSPRRKVRGFPGCGKKTGTECMQHSRAHPGTATAAAPWHARQPRLQARGPGVLVFEPIIPGPSAPRGLAAWEGILLGKAKPFPRASLSSKGQSTSTQPSPSTACRYPSTTG